MKEVDVQSDAMQPSNHSLAGTLAGCARYLAPSLASPAAWRRLEALASRLPASLSSCFHLECHLTPPSGRVDLILGIDEPGREILRGSNARLRLPSALRHQAAWQRLAELCRRWHSDRDLGRRLQRLWLEFDLPDGVEGAVPVPRIFLDVLDPATGWRAALQPLVEACEDFAGEAAPGALRAGLEACWSLGNRHHLHSVGLAPERRPAYRLCLRCSDLAGVEAVLAAIGYVSTRDALRRRLRRYRLAGTRPWLLDLDLGDARRGPAFGLEWKLGHHTEPGSVSLQQLAAGGWLRSEALEALGHWPGSTIERLRHQLWSSRVCRRVNHCKLVPGPAGATQAKVYLRLEHTPRRRPDTAAPGRSQLPSGAPRPRSAMAGE